MKNLIILLSFVASSVLFLGTANAQHVTVPQPINEYQAAGFKDAFPVAYFNGERISLTEACCQEVMAAK